MFNHLHKIYSIYQKSHWHQWLFQITLLWMISLLAGCASTQPYENPKNGIKLQKPNNWSLKFTERNGTLTLKAETGFLDKNSAHIEIFTHGCPSEGDYMTSDTSSKILEDDIHRIGELYGLNSVETVQEPTSIETKHKDYQITKTVIKIPTTSMLDDLERIEVGKPGPGKFQTIDIFLITNFNNTVKAYIYKGNSDELDSSAQEIVDSIQVDCGSKQ
jgi:hypothetical protein